MEPTTPLNAAGGSPNADLSRPPVDPAIIEWAARQFDPVEAAENLKEIRETGGLRLCDFIHDLEKIARE